MTVTEDWASGRWYPDLHIPRWFTTGQSHKGRCCEKSQIHRWYGVHSWRGSGMQRRYLMLHICICMKKMWACEMIIEMLFGVHSWRGSGMQRRYLMLHIWICMKKMWACEMIIVMLFDSLVWLRVSQNRTFTIGLHSIYFSQSLSLSLSLYLSFALSLSVCLPVSVAAPTPSILLCFHLSLSLSALPLSLLDSVSPSESFTPSESHFSHLVATVWLPLSVPRTVSLSWLILTVVPTVVFVVCFALCVWSHTECKVDLCFIVHWV